MAEPFSPIFSSGLVSLSRTVCALIDTGFTSRIATSTLENIADTTITIFYVQSLPILRNTSPKRQIIPSTSEGIHKSVPTSNTLSR